LGPTPDYLTIFQGGADFILSFRRSNAAIRCGMEEADVILSASAYLIPQRSEMQRSIACDIGMHTGNRSN